MYELCESQFDVVPRSIVHELPAERHPVRLSHWCSARILLETIPPQSPVCILAPARGEDYLELEKRLDRICRVAVSDLKSRHVISLFGVIPKRNCPRKVEAGRQSLAARGQQCQ